MIGSPAFIAWLAYGAFLQALGVLVIARRVYLTGRQFGARPMRAVRLWVWLRASPGVMRRWLIARWLRMRHVPTFVPLSGTSASISGASARLSVSYEGDTPVTRELRRRIEDLSRWR